MRKIATIMLCVLLMLCLFGCANQQQTSGTEPTDATDLTQPVPVVEYNDDRELVFTEEYSLCGMDVTGKNRTEVNEMLKAAVQNYVLDLTVNDAQFHLTAEDLGLQFKEYKLVNYMYALKNGEDPSAHFPLIYEEGILRNKIANTLNVLSQNVSIVYNEETNKFEFVDAIPGMRYDMVPVIEEVNKAIASLASECTTTAIGTQTSPAITAESETAIAALEKANAYLDIILVYGYIPSESIGEYEVVTEDDIGSFITFDSYMNPTVDEAAVLAYAERMSECYSKGLNDGKFLTSHGYYQDVNIVYADQLVDTQALAEDITYCLRNNISGARYATYYAQGKGYAHDLGGNYVEIDLTAQRLWVYKDYECKLYTPIVTGNLSEDWATPNGVYKVYQRIYPTRPSRVFRYWMPFLGAYGLHDANWRSEYRSDEYLFEGSHGCVNIPPENFLGVYNNVTIGTPVIIYGGANNGDPVTQVISGTTEYNVGVEVGKFTLDAQPKYGFTEHLSYTSDNPEVATVSEEGVVTVLATGTARITVKSKDWDFCPSVEKVITIKVHEDCSEVGHMIVNWTQVEAATCTSTGTEEGVCTSCDYSETRTINETHNFFFPAYMHPQSWVVTKAPTCTEAGEKCRTCRKCGYQETAEIPAEDHIPVCWHITKYATATQTGEMTAKCYYCGLKITKEIPITTN